ncbi:SDR family NAD(P)-dependent oxidoreductase [Rufibacter glacialis]|uniref:SDR family NAD(P)-dependent oxidoreductase n=1 Tax=Rufibacter glacialis TaxID=1259555 RepID=A0A5M8QI70_9BACT|nr:SDR family NAD(P)-dependent oxidoreductase [Rufibacter glacialis]KAA6435735.1 SDR family NAD(P)-dependent oxidoreductase [Rufibacter glacialis]GGK66079.1 benzil reductase [Rufibacter glacialis]
MNYYIITGASRGLGKALAEALLEDEQNCVVGVSRNSTITHARYRHQPLDFSDIAGVEHNLHKVFAPFEDAQNLVLVNNAGVIGEIGYMGQSKNEHFEFVFDVNVIVPAMFMNLFLQSYQHRQNCGKMIVNISSGAGQKAKDGWAAYCASKAALDMLSQTAQLEQDQLNTGIKVFSVAPGIIDTDMQEQIREADVDQFSSVQQFRDYKAQGALASPEEAAQKILRLINEPQIARGVVCSVRDF